jgi:hypothetical protein
MLDSQQRSLDRAFQLENCTQGANQRCTYGTGVTESQIDSQLVCMVHHEEAPRYARSARGARNAGLLTAFLGSSISARKLLKVRISDALMAPAFVLRVRNTAPRRRDTIRRR